MPVVPREKVYRAYRNALAAGDAEAVNALRGVLVGRTTPLPTSAPRETGIFEDITSGFGAGLVGMGELTALGLATPLEEESELAARERIQSIAESFRPEGGDPESITYKLSSVFGGITGLAGVGLGATALGAPGAAVATGLGALGIGLSKGEASERARDAGATVEEREKAVNAPLVLLAGVLEVVPLARVVKLADLPTLTKLLEKIPPEKVETIGERLTSAGITGSAELTQEAASNILQNLTEQEYNAAREVLGADTAEEAALGGGAGAILQGFVDLFAPRRGGKTIGDAAEEAAPVEEAEPRVTDALPTAATSAFGEADIAAEADSQARASARMDERQADMFALEKEQAERRLGPAMREEPESELQAERDRLFPEETSTEASAAQRDMIDELETAQIEEAVAADRQAAIAEDDAEIASMLETEERIAAGVDAAETAQIERMVTEDAEQEKRRDAARAGLSPYASIDEEIIASDSDVSEIEARIREKAPRLITEEDLTAAGFKPNAAIRKRITGKDLNDPEIRADLANAGQKFKSQKVKDGVDRLLKGAPREQRNLPTSTKRESVTARSRTGDAVDLRSVGDDAGRANTVESATPIGGAVADAGGSTGRSVSGEGRKRGALARKVTSAVAKANAARTEVAKAEKAVTVKPTQKNQRALKQAEREFDKAVKAGKIANAQIADVDTQVIPQETVEAQRRAERAMPATAATTPATVEEVLTKEPTPAPAEPTVEESTADVDLRTREEVDADKESLLAERRKARDELMAADPRMSKAEAMRIASGQVLNAPPRDYTEVLDVSLPDTVKRAVRNNELRRALLELSNKSDDKFIKRVAARLAKLTGDTKIMTVPPSQLGTVDGKQVDGRFITADNTIVLNKDYTDVYVLLHEMAHAATIDTLKNPSHPTTKKLMKLHEVSKEYLRNSYGSKNVAEFVAEAFTNPTFQGELARINPDGKPLSVWQEFIRVVSNFLGLGKERGTAQREAQQLIEDILAPAAKHRGAPLLASMTDPAGVRRVEEGLKDALPKGPVERAKERIVGEYGALTAGQKNTGLKRKILGLLPNNAVEVELERAGVVGVKDVFAAIENQRGGLTSAEQAVRNRLQPIREWAAKQSGETIKAWNNLIYDSTVDQVDPELTPQQAQKRYGNDTVEGTSQLKIDRYKELRAIYNSKTVGAEGRKNYTALRKLYKDQYDQLNDTLQNRIDGLPIAEQAKTNLKNGLYAKMLEATKLEPYFPLTRTGTYFLSVKNPKEGADSAVFAYENAAERFRAAEAYEAEGYEVSTFNPSDKTSYEDAPSGSFVSSILGIMKTNKVDPEVQEQITRLFIEYLPESSFAKSLLRRKGTEGYDVDAVEAARTKAFDLARQVERIKNSRLIDNAVQEMLEANPKMADANSPEIEEVKDRARFAVNPPLDSFAKNANRMAFMWTIGFNASSALVNLSQIPLFAYPMLAGKYGFGATRTALSGATKLFMGSPTNKDIATLTGDARTPRSVKEALRKGDLNAAREALKDKALPSLDNYYTFSRDKDGRVTYEVRKDLDLDAAQTKELKELLPLMELASRRGQLNSSFIADTLSTSQAGRKMSKMDAVTNASALMFHEAEVMNRQVTMVAAYKLALKKFNGDKEKAAEEAVRETQLINGGATLETGPRYAREGLGRIALMYKAYGIQMYYTMFKSGRQAIENFFPGTDAKSRELRNEALKQLAGVHLSALFFAGVQGLPLYGAISMLIDMFREDYEEDTDTMLRQYLDSDVLFKGALSEITGVDVSQRVKLTDLLFEADRFNSDPSPEEEIAHLFGGPAWSIYSRGRDGIDKLREGDIERGIEDLMPGAVRNAYKAVIRYPRDEGILTRRGDPIYDDLTAGDLATQLLGFPPVDYTREADETSTAKRLDIAASAERRNLLRRYYVAKRFGDREGMRDAKQAMREFNKSSAVRRDRQKGITGDTIDRSIRGHQTRSIEMHNGTTLSPYMKRAVDSGEGFL